MTNFPPAQFERTILVKSATDNAAQDPWAKAKAKSESPNQAQAKAESSSTDASAMLAVNVLAAECPISKQKIKQAMQNGAVWLRRKNKKVLRVRRAKTALRPGDEISIFYDQHVQEQVVEPPQLIADEGRYSVWNKPAGMLSQGSKYGDHCAITRWIEKNSDKSRTVYLAHRLDRAASGLILIAHDSALAAQLSRLFQSREIEKTYQVRVHGQFEQNLPYQIDSPLDGKSAISIVTHSEIKQDTTELTIQIETGRKHQIRRHLADSGFPVVGDHLYGREEDRDIAMQLQAVELKFISPVTQKPVVYLNN